MGTGRSRLAGTDAGTISAALLMTLTWGSSAVATKVGLASYGPGQLTLLRFLVTGSLMVLYALVTRMRLPARRDIPPLVGLGLIGISIPQLGFGFGIASVDPGTATFLISTVPVMTAILARCWLGEHLSLAGWSGISLTVIGTIVLVLGQGEGLAFTRGAVILLGGAFAEALYFILQKPFLQRYTSQEVSTWALIAASVPLLVFFPPLPAQFQAASPGDTAAVVYAGLGAGVLGYFCMAYVNARLPASITAVLMAGMPPVALVTAWLWIGVTPPLLAIAGGLVSVSGVVLVTQKGRASASHVTPPAPALALPAAE
ncbi:MAG: DMT family transporter [Thermomicrobiales bacterium]|nr:DMT family transporter [Thermomicrobiales bacterium]